jgi:hypothetical protein
VEEEAFVPTFFSKLENDESSCLALFTGALSSSYGRFVDPFTPYKQHNGNNTVMNELVEMSKV